MADISEERLRERVWRMRMCTSLAARHGDLIDRYEETGDPVYWNAFVQVILDDSKPESPRYPQK